MLLNEKIKTCSQCGETKEASSYYKNRAKCKTCCVYNSTQYKKNNTEQTKTNQLLWRQANKVYTQQYSLEWRKQNPDKVKLKNLLFRINNPEYGKQWREKNAHRVKTIITLWNLRNKDKVLAKYKRYYEKNPGALLRRNVGFIASITIKARILARDSYRCQLCASANTLIMHHIIPKSKNITLIAEPDNLIILCSDCHKNKAHSGNYKYLNESLVPFFTEMVSLKKKGSL